MSKKQKLQQTGKTKKILKDTNDKQRNGGNKKEIVSKIRDKRFESAMYDPKFATPKANLGKVKIDKRFADRMQSQNFKFGTHIDKYGRKNTQQSKLGGMSDYYYTQNQPEQKQQKSISASANKHKNKKVKKAVNKQQQQFESIQNHQEKNQQVQEQQNQGDQDQAQGYQNRISKWMQDYNEQSSSDQLQQLDQQIQDSDSMWSDDKQNVIKNQNVQVTKRLALCNYDWMNITAKDLMLLFSSFKPNTGTILKISVYYSQFGKDKMKMEQLYGPQGIWKQQTEQQQPNGQKESHSQRYKYRNELPKAKKQEQAFNLKKLRAYEKQRLKYCYAVIQCNSKKTADQIYKQCDGNQFQSSNVQFDLRFIPDNIEFDPSMLKQKCQQIPISGEVKNFVSRATGHSNVSLTWQDPQLNQIATLKNKNWSKMTDVQMDKINWAAYIDEQNQIANDKFNSMANKKDSVMAQTKQSKGSDWRSQCNKQHRRKKQQDDLQITFTSGFDKNAKSGQQKISLNKQLKTRKQRWRQHEQQKKKRQHLQLLVEKSDQKQFKYNPQDQRFKAVLNNPTYYIDPSHPKFDHRKSGAVFQQVVKNNRKKNMQ